MWNQHERIEQLNQQTLDQYNQLLQCRDLIQAQRQYIDILEADYHSPLYRHPAPLNRGPI